jgi:glycerophosphoryl diester phosphodiesterase
MRILLYSLLTVTVVGCGTAKKNATVSKTAAFDFEAHRGGRGLMPENTIPAMLNAIRIPEVVTLEMDVHISKDGQVLVSHDPYFNAAITTTPDGKYLSAKEGQAILLYKMNYADIKKYDVGMKPHPDFPRQQKLAVSKPLLSVLIDSVEQFAAANHRVMLYNIEIKSKKEGDNINHPEPGVFAEKLIAVLKEKRILDRCVIQSFDPRAIQVVHQQYPSVQTSFLVDKNGADKLDEQLKKLDFLPTIYSPVYTAVTQELVDACHAKKIKIIPWTVNSAEEIQRLAGLGVDGLISDYPDLFKGIKTK